MNLHNPSFECAGCGRMVGPPNVWIDDGATWCSECVALGARARRWMRLEYRFLRALVIGLVLGVLLLAAAQCANGQTVPLEAEFSYGRVDVPVWNGTQDTIWITARLLTNDAIPRLGGVEVEVEGARVTPDSFPLPPGRSQVIRVVVRGEPPDSILRLAVLMMPRVTEGSITIGRRVLVKLRPPTSPW